ncbi:MAG TPA: threonylcarbamoyl-AMP synthase [Syntrophaceae bacterium]|nr:threonylcarbamoyl-AMP synthase [Syntrophaceae bacterium]
MNLSKRDQLLRNRIEKIDSSKPDQPLIFKAAQIITAGGIVAYPTETFYGLGVDAFNVHAIERIYYIKKRDPSKPILVIIENQRYLKELVSDVPPSARKLIKRFWPGPLTIIFKASPKVPAILTGNTGTIGMRISNHPVALELVRAVGRPITATSANISGQLGLVNALDVFKTFKHQLDLILDGGVTQGKKGTTIVNIALDPPRIVREGVISSKEIQQYLVSSKG